MRYIIFIGIILAVGWIIFIQDDATSPNRVTRTLTDSEVLPITNGSSVTSNDDEENHLDVIIESPDDDKALGEEPIDLPNSDIAFDDDNDTVAVDTPEEVILVDDQDFVLYNNKSVSYSVQRPDKWYWQHFHKSEIGENNPVEDYLVMDRAPLIGLSSEYLGRIVVEVSTRPLSEYSESVSGASSSATAVSSVEAMRYKGERNGTTFIEYQFVANGKTFRIFYTNSNTTTEEEQIFEFLVDSFTLS